MCTTQLCARASGDPVKAAGMRWHVSRALRDWDSWGRPGAGGGGRRTGGVLVKQAQRHVTSPPRGLHLTQWEEDPQGGLSLGSE